MTRQTMKKDPLEFDNLDDLKKGARTRPAVVKEAPAAEKKKTSPLQAYIPDELLDKARDAVYWTPGLTLTAFVVQALEHEIAKLEKDRGEPFPVRKQQLRAGRPVGS